VRISPLSMLKPFALLLTFCACASAAQTYPARPLRLLVAYPPGGATDITARVVAPKMGDSLGQQVIVDNRPGANGLVATAVLGKSAPDGHTLMVVDSAHSANPALYAKIPYDTLRDFTAVGLAARIPMVLLVNPSLPVKSVKELIALA
jgi:tripartite-type tricarboxylate transporter receptor subunit TctC